MRRRFSSIPVDGRWWGEGVQHITKSLIQTITVSWNFSYFSILIVNKFFTTVKIMIKLMIRHKPLPQVHCLTQPRSPCRKRTQGRCDRETRLTNTPAPLDGNPRRLGRCRSVRRLTLGHDEVPVFSGLQFSTPGSSACPPRVVSEGEPGYGRERGTK